MFSFEKFYDVGEYISQKDGEEYDRAAISRYYYSIFGCSRLYLIFILGEYDFQKGTDVHKRICNRLKESNDSTEHALGLTLDKLRQIRNFADYDWYEKDESFFEKKLMYVKKESKIGLEQLNALKNSPPYKF